MIYLIIAYLLTIKFHIFFNLGKLLSESVILGLKFLCINRKIENWRFQKLNMLTNAIIQFYFSWWFLGKVVKRKTIVMINMSASKLVIFEFFNYFFYQFEAFYTFSYGYGNLFSVRSIVLNKGYAAISSRWLFRLLTVKFFMEKILHFSENALSNLSNVLLWLEFLK